MGATLSSSPYHSVCLSMSFIIPTATRQLT